MENSTIESCWPRVQERLRAEVGDDIYNAWFARIEFSGLQEACVSHSVPTRFLKTWIQQHYADRLLECWQGEQPGIMRVEIITRSPVIRTMVSSPIPPRAAETKQNGHTAGNGSSAPVAPTNIANCEALSGSPLDPRLSFDNFVVAESNLLAHATVTQVAKAENSDLVTFNPLYIHAAIGLGKTHLLQSLAWVSTPKRRVLYLTAEKLMYTFMSELRERSWPVFKKVLLGIDVFVVDDLQYLRGKLTQQEFCHVLNAFVDGGQQVVVAADRPPGELDSLDERLCSRLAGGLVVEMGNLNEETRLNILKLRIAAVQRHHPQFEVPEDVLRFVAGAVTNNGRGLEGAINRLLANSTLTGQAVTLEMAEREVCDLTGSPEPKRIKVEEIQRVVARHYNVSRVDIISARRTADVVRPRQVAMYLVKVLTPLSLPAIGRRFGGRDHTTVLHAVRKIENLVNNDSVLAENVEILKHQLQE